MNRPFDKEGHYLVKPPFLAVLCTVEGVDQLQEIFPFREITLLLSARCKQGQVI